MAALGWQMHTLGMATEFIKFTGRRSGEMALARLRLGMANLKASRHRRKGRRGQIIDFACPHCNEEDETEEHYLCDCSAWTTQRLQLRINVMSTLDLHALPILSANLLLRENANKITQWKMIGHIGNFVRTTKHI